MKRRALGKPEIIVSAIGLGGMPMSTRNRPDRAQSIETIHAALDAGVTLIDTADVYCLDQDDIGHNERLIAEALQGADVEVLVATKGGLARPGGAWTRDGRPEHLMAACEASLKALGVDCIDLYQLHAPDAEVPFADSVGALARLREQGRIRHVGLSNVSVAQIEEARAIVEIVSVQNRAHPLDTSAWTSGVVAHCEAHGIAFLPYSPVGGWRRRDELARHPVLNDVAQRTDHTPQEVALAWLLHTSPVMIPIPGASRPASIRSSARAAELVLSATDRAALDGAFLGGAA